jgi:hypothetical protein
LFGTSRRRINQPGDDYYSWQDEVLQAQRQLEQRGGSFVFL